MSKPTVALVTGASKGLGQEIAIALAKSGHTVLAVARSKSGLDSLIDQNQGSIFGYEADVSEYKNIEN